MINFLYVRSIPSYLSWIKYLLWSNYGYEALVVNQWKYLDCEKYNSTMDTINCNEEIELVLVSGYHNRSNLTFLKVFFLNV